MKVYLKLNVYSKLKSKKRPGGATLELENATRRPWSVDARESKKKLQPPKAPLPPAVVVYTYSDSEEEEEETITCYVAKKPRWEGSPLPGWRRRDAGVDRSNDGDKKPAAAAAAAKPSTDSTTMTTTTTTRGSPSSAPDNHAAEEVQANGMAPTIMEGDDDDDDEVEVGKVPTYEIVRCLLASLDLLEDEVVNHGTLLAVVNRMEQAYGGKKEGNLWERLNYLWGELRKWAPTPSIRWERDDDLVVGSPRCMGQFIRELMQTLDLENELTLGRDNLSTIFNKIEQTLGKGRQGNWRERLGYLWRELYVYAK